MVVDKMNKKDLAIALKEYGYVDEQLKSMKRPELIEKLKAENSGSEGLDMLAGTQESVEDNEIGVQVVQDDKKVADEVVSETSSENVADSDPEEAKVATIPPTPNDKGWTQYVLGHFLEDEVDGVNPRVEGLRRIASLLVGPIVEEGCDLVAAPDQNNGFRACVKAWFIFNTGEGTKRFEALADANSDNCMEGYATYLVAMADTRAKGRVLRNALLLRRVVAAEEVSKTMATSADIQQGGSIHTGQIAIIHMMSDRHNFDIKEILNRLNITHELNDRTGEPKLQLLSYEESLDVSKEMRLMIEEKEKANA